MSWRKKVKLAEIGDNITSLYSSTGLPLATGYTRVVFGERGPYVEFNEEQIFKFQFHIPEETKYRFKDKRSYYIEYRSNDSANVMLYYQLRKVAYADYKLGMYYISPKDLYDADGNCMVDNKQNGDSITDMEFFQ